MVGRLLGVKTSLETANNFPLIIIASNDWKYAFFRLQLGQKLAIRYSNAFSLCFLASLLLEFCQANHL